MRKNFLKLPIILGIAVAATSAAFAVEEPKKCPHPCEPRERNACCVGTYTNSNGEVINWSVKGVHFVEQPL